MSGTFPNFPLPVEISIVSLSPTRVSISHSLKRHIRSTFSHRWGMELRYDNLERDSFAPLFAFAVDQDGQAETFDYVPPVYSNPRGSITGAAPLVNGADQTGSTINIDGATPSITGILMAGDFIKFQGDLKVYMVTADVDSDGFGEMTIPIKPRLQLSPSDDSSIIFEDIIFNMALTEDTVSLLVRSPFISEGFTVGMIEDI